jgi:Brp/Blh family beta-carotene 15,15'-monooxygenase
MNSGKGPSFPKKVVPAEQFSASLIARFFRKTKETLQAPIPSDPSFLGTLPVTSSPAQNGPSGKEVLQSIRVPFSLLLLTLLLLILQNTSVYYFDLGQKFLFVAGILVIGLPHGAVDYLLDSGRIDARVSLTFVLKYLALALFNYILWLVLPTLAVIFFIFYSAWHFGETDMQAWQPRRKSPLKDFVWGIVLLGIILFGHASEVNHVISFLSISPIPFTAPQVTAICYLLLAFALAWTVAERRSAMLLSVLMLAGSIGLPLITSFGLYFIGQHSLNGWRHLTKGMKTSNFALYLKALPFTLAALIFFAVIYFAHNHVLLEYKENWFTLFFVFISCISFPHVVAMNKFYRNYFS